MKPIQRKPSLHIISTMSTRKVLRKGYWAYLAYIINTQKEVKLDNISIIREFFNIFSDELPGLPLDRVIDFEIDIMPGVGPISKPPYRTTLIELQELKV